MRIWVFDLGIFFYTVGYFLSSFFRLVFESFLGGKKGAQKEVFGGQNEVNIKLKT